MLEEITNEQYLWILQAHVFAYGLAAVCCHEACTYTVSWIVLSYENWPYCLC